MAGEQVERWRSSQKDFIAVTDTVKLSSSAKPMVLPGAEWRAVVATVPADQIVDLHTKYGGDLFSPNVRDYLGSRGTAANINHQIEMTAREEPGNFWV